MGGQRFDGPGFERLAWAGRLGWRTAAGIAAGVVLAGGVELDRRIAAAEAENRALAERAREREAPAREAAAQRRELDALSRRGAALDALLRERGRPAQLLAALPGLVPTGIHLRAISLQDDAVTVDGVARTNERVAVLLRELGAAPWLARAELIESRAEMPAQRAAGEPRSHFAFSMRLVYAASAPAADARLPADVQAEPAAAPPSPRRSPHDAG